MNVLIRLWTMKDAPALVDIANNRNVWNTVRDRFPFPYTEKDADEFIKLANGKQPVENFCIEADGAVAGSIGVILFQQNYRKNVEIGYFIGESFWGQGLASEAVRLMLPYIYQTFDVVRLFGLVFEHNTSSMRVLEKNGFVLECIHQKAALKNGVVLDEYVWVKFNTGHPDYE